METVPPGFVGQRTCECFPGARVWPHIGPMERGYLPFSQGALLRVSKRALQKGSEAQESGQPEECEAGERCPIVELRRSVMILLACLRDPESPGLAMGQAHAAPTLCFDPFLLSQL